MAFVVDRGVGPLSWPIGANAGGEEAVRVGFWDSLVELLAFVVDLVDEVILETDSD